MKKELFSINISVYSNGEVFVKQPCGENEWVTPLEKKKRGRPRLEKRNGYGSVIPVIIKKRKYTKRSKYWKK